MIGRKVKTVWGKIGAVGEIIRWEPLGSGMCDTFVRWDDGSECWHGSTDLRPVDDLGPLPSRQEAIKAAKEETLRSLHEIKRQHIRDWVKPWPGCEHGKAIIGNAINGAIKKIEEE